jgi:hypothetical protein
MTNLNIIFRCFKKIFCHLPEEEIRSSYLLNKSVHVNGYWVIILGVLLQVIKWHSYCSLRQFPLPSTVLLLVANF